MGVTLKQLSGRPGYVRTMGNIYVHYLRSDDKTIADKLENFYRETKNDPKNR